MPSRERREVFQVTGSVTPLHQEPSEISQKEIETQFGLINELRGTKRVCDQNADHLLGRVLSGCVVEVGNHSLDVEHTYEEARRVTYLIINGVRYRSP